MTAVVVASRITRWRQSAPAMRSTHFLFVLSTTLITYTISGPGLDQSESEEICEWSETPTFGSLTLKPSPEFQMFQSILLGSAKNLRDMGTDPLDYLTLRQLTQEKFGHMVPGPTGMKQQGFRFESRPGAFVSAKGVSTELRDGAALFFHGDAFMFGDYAMYGGMLGHLSEEIRLPMVYLDHANSPEVLHPLNIEPYFEVYGWLLENRGTSPNNLVLIGDASGATLLLLFLQQLRARNLSQPACAVLISPITNLNFDGESFKTMEFNEALYPPGIFSSRLSKLVTEDGTSLSSPDISPLFGDFTGLCPLMFMVGQNEVLLSDTLRCAAVAKSQGVDVWTEVATHMVHSYPLYGHVFPESKRARERIAQYVKLYHT